MRLASRHRPEMIRQPHQPLHPGLLHPRLGLGLLVLLTALVYWPGLSGQYIFDDFPNIVWKQGVQIKDLNLVSLQDAWASGHAGPLGRPLAMVSFAFNHLASGLDPWWFKLTNLIIHIVNGLLFFALARILLHALHPRGIEDVRIDTAALLAAAIWLLHPFNLSPVLYVVQRMTLLAALFVLAGLLVYAYGRQSVGKLRWALISSAYLIFLPLAALSKENGALLPAYLFALEFFIFRFKTGAGLDRGLVLLHSLTFLLPSILLLGYSIHHPEWYLAGYANRDFTLSERLLTEARVIWGYLLLTLIPDISRMGLFHDVEISVSLWQPWTTLPAIIGLIGLAALAWMARHRQPMFAFAIAVFFLGHSMESSILALEIMHEHRNYLPSFALVLAIAGYLLPVDRIFAPSLAALGLILVVSLAAATSVRAHVWGDTRTHMILEASNHPASASANYEAGRALFSFAESLTDEQQRSVYFAMARMHFERVAASANGEAALGMFPLLIITSSQGESKEAEALLARLADVLRTRPIPSVTSDYLRSIALCQQRGHCLLKPDSVWTLFQSALVNPRMSGYGKSLLLIQSARYAWFGLNDRRLALELASQAAESYPSSGCHRIDQIQMLQALGAIEEAKRMLALARNHDTGGCKADLINLHKALEAMPQEL